VLTFFGYADARFDLDVVGYQFPDAELDGWDSEWLRVAGVVSSDRGKWKFCDPCLTTFELKALADWFRSSPEEESERAIGFTEPNLSFARAGVGLAEELVVSFAQESTPPWATEQEKYGVGFSVTFPIALNDCSALAIGIEKILEQFPVRALPTGFAVAQSERNKPLQANETQVTGNWLFQNGRPNGDASCERIDWLIEHVLREVAVSPDGGGWETLYRDPGDGRFWERVYPHSEMHGGGPPRLHVLTIDEVREKYGTL
jgi:hypothetical protein